MANNTILRFAEMVLYAADIGGASAHTKGMDTQLWDLFRETGDPLGYLLYRAEAQKKPGKQEVREKTQKGGADMTLSL